MAFNSYEELKAAAALRRQAILTLEVDLGSDYSPEYEAAKTALKQAQAMKTAMGGAGFLGDNIEELEQRVAETKPAPNSVWIQYKKLDIGEWAMLMKQSTMSAVDQYEKVLPKTFIALYGQDPKPDPVPEGWEAPEPFTTDARSVSSRSSGEEGILPGPLLHSVVQSFMAWQNSSGDVTIRPTKSGLV